MVSLFGMYLAVTLSKKPSPHIAISAAANASPPQTSLLRLVLSGMLPRTFSASSALRRFDGFIAGGHHRRDAAHRFAKGEKTA
jgi:hypothetical protein